MMAVRGSTKVEPLVVFIAHLSSQECVTNNLANPMPVVLHLIYYYKSSTFVGQLLDLLLRKTCGTSRCSDEAGSCLVDNLTASGFHTVSNCQTGAIATLAKNGRATLQFSRRRCEAARLNRVWAQYVLNFNWNLMKEPQRCCPGRLKVF
jgi:hypothetical protein